MTRLLRREKEAAAQVLSLMTVFISLFVTISFSLISAIQAIDAQPESISVQNTIITAPVTILVPITADVQNAQICLSIASSGGQSCTQVVVDPVENSYDPVSADLSSETPTLTTAEQEPTATTAPTTTEPTTTITTTTTEEQPTAPTTPAPTTTTTTEPTLAPTEEPTTDTGTQEGGTTTEEPAPDSGTQEPTTEGSTSEGGSQ
jgi:hypothetical protein